MEKINCKQRIIRQAVITTCHPSPLILLLSVKLFVPFACVVGHKNAYILSKNIIHTRNTHRVINTFYAPEGTSEGILNCIVRLSVRPLQIVSQRSLKTTETNLMKLLWNIKHNEKVCLAHKSSVPTPKIKATIGSKIELCLKSCLINN